jgi:hypothetical protein
VADSGESQIVARVGNVEVFTPRGSQWVYAGQMMLARGTSSDPEFEIVQAPAPDDWDRWSDGRDHPILNSPSQQYVPPGVYGTESLDGYGNWVNVPQYGNVWQPTVAAGWAPYRNGRWAWLDWYGWTWVSYDPWGWAPYHYGRWFYQPAFGWCWYPGALGIYHYWSPALVAFFGFGGAGFGFGFGNVGWVPLAPFEALRPWWGRGIYGNSGYFNRQVNVTNVNVFNTYRNARVTNGFTAVRGTDFRNGRFTNFVRPTQGELSQASLARGALPIAPGRSNLGYSNRPATSIARTAPARVYSYRGGTANPAVPRIPFAQQQRAFGGGGAPAPAAGAGRGWTRFGEPSGNSPSTGGWRSFSQRTPSEPASGFSRFGEPYAAPRQPSAPAPRAEAPRSFGQNYGVAPRSPEPLRVAPPLVRERPGGGGFGEARPVPRGNSGGFARPAPAPRQRGGGFGSPAPRSAPRSGGGGRSSGGNHGGRR